MQFPDISNEIFSVTLFGITLALRWYALAYIAGILGGWFAAGGGGWVPPSPPPHAASEPERHAPRKTRRAD